MSGPFIRLVEADEAAVAIPGKFLIRVIQAGPSLNNNVYPPAVLREAAPLFNGVRVFVKSDAEHIAGAGKDVRNLVGKLTDARFVEARIGAEAEIQAVLTLLSPDSEIGHKLREAVAGDMTDLFGFSVDVTGTTRRTVVAGKALREAVRISRVSSVDLIVEPGAGGRLIRMVESFDEGVQDVALRELLLQQLKEAAPAVHAKLATDATDDEIGTALREALARPVPPAAPPAPPAADFSGMEERVRMVEARSTARAVISACTLPQPAKDRLHASFDRLDRFVEADVATAIEGERTYLARFVESGRVAVGDFPGIQVEDRSVKIGGMLDAFFDPKHKDHRETHSFREAYVEITGDKRVSGRMEDCDRSRMAESLGRFAEALDSTSFANALGNSMTRRMVADYNEPDPYSAWTQIATVVPVADFRAQERVRIGGYGDIPAVAQAAAYTALSSPTDEKSTYAISKRGGTENVTLEMIRNDDVGAVRRIPLGLSRAAKRTLGKFVFDFLRTNPAIYDGKSLFHVDHGNLGTAALSAAAVAAGRLAMLKQTELNSGDRLGIGPQTLLVPADLEETAVDLFRRNTNLDKTFAQSLTLAILPVWYWADVTDWVLAANPMDIPTIEVGFLDGRQEPELFVQDAPTVGSLFANDTITYKLRHIYGGNVLDYRGLYKSVVAG